MEKIEAHRIKSHPLSTTIDVSSFDCDDQDLNGFLKDDALNYQNQGLAQTTCVFYDDKLIGYYAIAADALRLSIEEKKFFHRKKRIKSYPAVKLARMAFLKEYCRKGLGTMMLHIIKGFAYEQNKKGLAIKFITVDAYKNALSFYEKNGFIKNNEQEKEDTISMRHHLFGES